MIITVMKGKFKKKDPKIINFRCCKNFDENLFRSELKNALRDTPKELDNALRDTPKELDNALRDTPKELDNALQDTPKELDNALRDTPKELDNALRDTPKELDNDLRDTPKEFDNALRDTPKELDNALRGTPKELDYDYFKQAFMNILNRHAPMKKKFIRGNNAPFMNMTLSQAFMHRSKLKNKYNNYPTEQNKRNCNQQRNFCVSLLKKEKRKYYNNLDLKIFKDNKTFCRRVKPLFSDKHKGVQPDIIIVEKGETTSDKKKVAEKLNTFFIGAVDNLDIEPYILHNKSLTENIQDMKTTPAQ